MQTGGTASQTCIWDMRNRYDSLGARTWYVSSPPPSWSFSYLEFYENTKTSWLYYSLFKSISYTLSKEITEKPCYRGEIKASWGREDVTYGRQANRTGFASPISTRSGPPSALRLKLGPCRSRHVRLMSAMACSCGHNTGSRAVVAAAPSLTG